MRICNLFISIPLVCLPALIAAPPDSSGLQVTAGQYLDHQGLSVLLYHNTDLVK